MSTQLKAAVLKKIRTPLSFLLLILLANISTATVRVQRHFDHTSGLITPTVFSLTQDADGFIWLGTAGGLLRYDGTQMRPWAKETFAGDVSFLLAGAGGEILASANLGTLYRITAEGAERLAGPGGNPIYPVKDVSFDGARRLWVVSGDGALHFRDPANNWHAINTGALFPGERVRRTRPALGDQIYVLTDKGVWRMRPDQNPQRVLETLRPIDVVDHPGGSTFVLAWWKLGEIFEVAPDGRSTVRATLPARAIDITVRGQVIWASFDRFLLALRGNNAPEIIGPDQDLPSGGPLIVDREGSLWLGTYDGLIQYPEPETMMFTHKDGLPTAHLRHLTLTDRGVWVTTWGPIGRVVNEKNVWHASMIDGLTARVPCVDGKGGLWGHDGKGVLTQFASGQLVKKDLKVGSVSMCHVNGDGSLWLATQQGLFRFYNDERPPQQFALLPGDDGQPLSLSTVLEDRSERLWVSTTDGRICHADVARIDSATTDGWTCQLVAANSHVYDLIQIPGGEVWAATNHAGLWRFRDERWEPHPGSRTLPSQSVLALQLSPSGGVWLMGHGISMRVAERRDLAEQWEVLEHLSAWQGLPGSGASDIIEDADGGLWLATSTAVIRVPAEARRTASTPPRIDVVEAVMNGVSMRNTEESHQVSHGGQVELHFAALSFRDRGRLRYQYRLRPDTPWSDSHDGAPVLRFVDLGAGDYQAEVRASVDGLNWSSQPARFSFKVLAPWYLQTWALVLFALFVAVILYAIYRARIAVLLRLERQRAQIARDLHDEMGSGLGSIGILSGLAAENNLDSVQHQELAKKISETAGELGTTLTEIVWALKPGTATLEALAYHLAERGGRLFPGSNGNFETHFPADWPKIELSLAVRRNVLLIASEAMHNAARHSNASRVVLGLESAGGHRWRLWLNDDGRGLSKGTNGPKGNGMGLENMKRRAAEIGARFSFERNNGWGTSLSLIFDPKADDLRVS